MRLLSIALGMKAAGGYDFGTKMRLNAFVIGEIVDALYPAARGADLTGAQNAVAMGMSDSADLHDMIGKLAAAINSMGSSTPGTLGMKQIRVALARKPPIATHLRGTESGRKPDTMEPQPPAARGIMA